VVRDHERDVAHVLYPTDVPCVERVGERLLQVAYESAFATYREEARLDMEIKAAHKRTRETLTPREAAGRAGGLTNRGFDD